MMGKIHGMRYREFLEKVSQIEEGEKDYIIDA